MFSWKMEAETSVRWPQADASLEPSEKTGKDFPSVRFQKESACKHLDFGLLDPRTVRE